MVKARKSPAALSVDKTASAVTCVGLFGEQRRRRLQLQTALHLQTQNTPDQDNLDHMIQVDVAWRYI